MVKEIQPNDHRKMTFQPLPNEPNHKSPSCQIITSQNTPTHQHSSLKSWKELKCIHGTQMKWQNHLKAVIVERGRGNYRSKHLTGAPCTNKLSLNVILISYNLKLNIFYNLSSISHVDICNPIIKIRNP